MKKKRLIYAIICVLLLLFAACGASQAREVEKASGLKVYASEIDEYIDTHGGFHGDGCTYIRVIIEQARADALRAEISGISGWKAIPMSETLNRQIYGSDSFQTIFTENAGFPAPPIITNGAYLFTDRHSNSTNPRDEAAIDRSSYNYTVALYDFDAHTLYIYKLDT